MCVLHAAVFFHYRCEVYFRTAEVPGVIGLPEGCVFNDTATTEIYTVELIQPIAMEEGLTFAVREGGHTVGSGRVTKILA